MQRWYLIGTGRAVSGKKLWVCYRPKSKDEPEAIAVVEGVGKEPETTCLPPAEMMKYENPTPQWKTLGAEQRFVGFEHYPNWFQEQCMRAKCEWFIPLVIRMRRGEDVAITEIGSGYFSANNSPIPEGPIEQLAH